MLFKLSELSLSENTSKRVQLAKVGTFNHQIYGKFSISLSDIRKMKKHFDANVRRQELETGPVIPIDYAHEDGKKSAGWGLKLSVDKDKKGVDGLFGEVEWTPAGAKAIRDKEFKFISPDIRRGYTDSETGEKFDVVLAGAALTNIPFLRDMEAVHLLSEDKQKAFESLKLSGDDPDNYNLRKGENMKTIEEILAALAKLSPEDKVKLSESLVKEFKFTTEEDSKKLSEDLEKAKEALKLAEESGGEKSDLEKQLKLSEGKVEELSKAVKKLVTGIAKKEREHAFDLKLSEGKVCEAQRERI
jgi:phage I-like protein